MAFTLYEYESVMSDGEPVQPPSTRTTAIASNTPTRLAANTKYAAVVAGADMYLRISSDGAAATTADHFLAAGETKGFPVRRPSRPYVYGLDAA